MNNDLNNIQGINTNLNNQSNNPQNSQNVQTASQQMQNYTNVVPSQNMYQQTEQKEMKTDPMAAVSNLNKEDAMEEALSHTTRYSPFELPKQEVNKEVKTSSNKGALAFIIIIFVIMLLFILFLPQISKLFGW